MHFKRLNLTVLHWIFQAQAQDGESDDTKKFRGKKFDFAVGGQAVIEGVMMRSPHSVTVATRHSSGEIRVKQDHYTSIIKRYKWLNIPILRGVVNLFEMMIIGSKVINYSASQLFDEEETKPSKTAETIFFTLSLIAALAFSIFLFKFLPFALTSILESHFSFLSYHYSIFNLVDGILKTLIFMTYIYLLTIFPDFRRLFEYHGAEHKAIFAYEYDKQLLPAEAQKMSRFHPRCGTSFIIIVFVISVLVYTIFPKFDSFLLGFALRVALLPLIAGIAYECLKFSARHSKSPLMQIFIAPGLWFQRLTTSEPDLPQLEVSLTSLKSALTLEEKYHQ